MSLNFNANDIPPGIPEPNPNANGSSQPGDDKRYCNLCKRKDPPVMTELILDVNITKGRLERSNFVCDECYNQRANDYRNNEKAKFLGYLEQLHDETVEELRTQWTDPAYVKLREMADRVYKIWSKYGRRWPSKGIRKNWIFEVLFADMWFADANTIVEDYMIEKNWSPTKRNANKNVLLQYVSDNLEREREPYRIKVNNKWDGIVNAIIRKYGSKEKLVAEPEHIDPITKESVNNWFLLSREREREIREQTRIAKKARFDAITEEEKAMIKWIGEMEIEDTQQKKDDGEKEGN